VNPKGGRLGGQTLSRACIGVSSQPSFPNCHPHHACCVPLFEIKVIPDKRLCLSPGNHCLDYSCRLSHLRICGVFMGLSRRLPMPARNLFNDRSSHSNHDFKRGKTSLCKRGYVMTQSSSKQSLTIWAVTTNVRAKCD
jgi:hypothetical protein